MTLLKWAAIMFVIAIVAALFGFGGIAEGAADIAQFLFWLFIVGAVILFLIGLFVGKAVIPG